MTGSVFNNEDVEVIKITSATLDSVKQIIEEKYGEYDDIRTYKITGDIQLIPTPITCGYMSGLSNTISVTQNINIQNRYSL